jgi:hypothetical protein
MYMASLQRKPIVECGVQITMTACYFLHSQGFDLSRGDGTVKACGESF